MKTIIAILVGIGVFAAVFMGVNALISLLLGEFTDPNVRAAMRIILWIFGFGVTFAVGIIGAILAGGITEIVLSTRRGKRRRR